MAGWPRSPEELERVQTRLAAARTDPWRLVEGAAFGGVFAASSTAGRAPERLWTAAALGGSTAVVRGRPAAPYEAGYLALREGEWLEKAVRALRSVPDVVLVNATGRDHPRGAGLALHLGAVLELPTVGVTDRPLVASADVEGRLVLDDVLVGFAVPTRRGARPVWAHAAWRTDPQTARRVVSAASGRVRTPEPLRLARFVARSARAIDEGTAPPGWVPRPPAPEPGRPRGLGLP
ncbi:MAG TPA: endonuclease V [Actinomycetota bacterium]|nr:endonuclease V [Actinomycetota bacterium]